MRRWCLLALLWGGVDQGCLAGFLSSSQCLPGFLCSSQRLRDLLYSLFLPCKLPALFSGLQKLAVLSFRGLASFLCSSQGLRDLLCSLFLPCKLLVLFSGPRRLLVLFSVLRKRLVLFFFSMPVSSKHLAFFSVPQIACRDRDPEASPVFISPHRPPPVAGQALRGRLL